MSIIASFKYKVAFKKILKIYVYFFDTYFGKKDLEKKYRIFMKALVFLLSKPGVCTPMSLILRKLMVNDNDLGQWQLTVKGSPNRILPRF